MIPLSVPNFEGNELNYVQDAVSQGWVSTGGAYITELEKKLAQYLDIEAAAACQSGTAALHLALLQSGVLAGELVIVPALTFIAAVNPVRYVGAEPVFMDCDDSLCLDPVKLRTFCRQECTMAEGRLCHKKTGKIIRALIVVHVFGNMADMEQIMEIAGEFGLSVVEDATEALGTRYTAGKYAGRYAGTIGDFGAYSFNGNKIITTGGGGAVTARDADSLAHMRYLSTQAKSDPLLYVHDEVGYNYRMTNVQAAIGVAQMEQLEEFIRRKNRNYDIYTELLQGCAAGGLLPFREETRANKWFYAFRIKEDGAAEKWMNALAQEDIQTRMVWRLNHRQKPYLNCQAYQIEKAEYYAEHILNLPCSTNIEETEIRQVCETLYKLTEIC